MLLHQMLAARKEDGNSASTLECIYSYAMICSALTVLCKCVIKYTKRGKSRGSCHIKNRAPVAYLMSPCHHPLLLPHISGFMFPPSSIARPGSQLAHAGTSREDNWRKITVQAQSDGKYGNQAADGRTAAHCPHPHPHPPVSASCHSLTDKLTF